MKTFKYFIIIIEDFFIILGVFFLLKKFCWEEIQINLISILFLSIVTAPISKILLDKVMDNYILKKNNN